MLIKLWNAYAYWRDKPTLEFCAYLESAAFADMLNRTMREISEKYNLTDIMAGSFFTVKKGRR